MVWCPTYGATFAFTQSYMRQYSRFNGMSTEKIREELHIVDQD